MLSIEAILVLMGFLPWDLEVAWMAVLLTVLTVYTADIQIFGKELLKRLANERAWEVW